MEHSTDDLIQRAMAEARAGDKPRAKSLLTEALKNHPNDARLWYLLSQVVETKAQAQECLERALRLDPDNPQILEKLEKLRQPTKLPELNLEPPPRAYQTSSEKPKRKTSWWVYVLLIIFVPVLGCMCFGTLFIDDNSAENIKTNLKLNHTVVYRVEGSASSATINYFNEQGGTEQRNGTRLPWSKSYEMKNGAPTSIVAQSNEYGKTITCIIELDGKEWKRSSSSGDFVLVTCAGWIGLE